MIITNRPAQRLRLAIPRRSQGGRPDATRHALLVHTTTRPVAKQSHSRLKRLGRSPHVFKRRTPMSPGLGGHACLAHRRERTTARRSGPTRRRTARPRPLADKPAVALSRRHGRIAIVVQTSAAGEKGRKSPTRVVQHEPVFGKRVQRDVQLTRRTRLRVTSKDVLDHNGPREDLRGLVNLLKGTSTSLCAIYDSA